MLSYYPTSKCEPNFRVILLLITKITPINLRISPTSGSAMVVPSMTTMISVYGTASQKGSVMGVFRALGALARAFGPITTSAGRHCALTYPQVFCCTVPGSLY